MRMPSANYASSESRAAFATRSWRGRRASTTGMPAVLFFFFSSRRRHTRYWRDWSSDVCSSDLGDRATAALVAVAHGLLTAAEHVLDVLRVHPQLGEQLLQRERAGGLAREVLEEDVRGLARVAGIAVRHATDLGSIGGVQREGALGGRRLRRGLGDPLELGI